MVQPILLHGLVVEPWAVAALPLLAAYHAKFGFTTARHVVAAFLKLHGSRAVVASLPAFTLRYLNELLSGVILWTDARGVPLVVACNAHRHPTAAAFCIFSAGIGSAARVDVDVFWFNPFSTAAAWAINPVFRGILLVFGVPLHFEFKVEKSVDMFERNMLVRVAATWRHVLRVGQGEVENALEARIAHTVRAGQQSSAGDRIGRKAC